MRAVLDANVLYPTVLREILIGLAHTGYYEPLWSDRLLQEWLRTADRRGGAPDALLAQGEIARLSAHFPGALVPPDPGLEAQLWLPDPADIHVLATAISGTAEQIVTMNLRDFPKRELWSHGVSAVHPDAFLLDSSKSNPSSLRQVVDQVHDTAQTLAGTPMPLKSLLKRARLPRLAKALAAP